MNVTSTMGRSGSRKVEIIVVIAIIVVAVFAALKIAHCSDQEASLKVVICEPPTTEERGKSWYDRDNRIVYLYTDEEPKTIADKMLEAYLKSSY